MTLSTAAQAIPATKPTPIQLILVSIILFERRKRSDEEIGPLL